MSRAVFAACLVAGGLAASACKRPAPPAAPGPASEPAAATAVAMGEPALAMPAAVGTPEPDWTTSTVDRPLKGLPEASVVVKEIRAARHEGFDRIVFEMQGETLPGYHVGYRSEAPVHCGSGAPVPVAGQRWLEIRLTPAQAHSEAGAPTVKDAEREQMLKLPVLQELELTCDFEGEVTAAAGLTRERPFRVLALQGPARIVVDVEH